MNFLIIKNFFILNKNIEIEIEYLRLFHKYKTIFIKFNFI